MNFLLLQSNLSLHRQTSATFVCMFLFHVALSFFTLCIETLIVGGYQQFHSVLLQAVTLPAYTDLVDGEESHI